MRHRPLNQVACNVCGSNETRLLFQKLNSCIVQCVGCELVYVNPREFQLEADDGADGYFEGPYLSTIETDGQLNAVHGTRYGEIIYNLSNRVPMDKLLDVGCAMGHFLGLAKSYGWEVEGIECSPFAARYAEKRFGVKVHPVSVLTDANLQKDFYDSCVLVDVIDQLPDPRETMTEVWRVLQPGGLVYITTPNFACYRSQLLREEWNVVIPSRHLYYFDSTTLGRLLSSIGFTDLENLTAPADFAADLKFAEKSGALKLTVEELAKVRECAELEPSSGRSEGLVMCARKPWDPTFEQSAFTHRFTRHGFKTSFEGCLVRKPGATPEDEKVYFVEYGRKRWVTTADWIIAKGMKWPEDLQFITPEELDSIMSGPPLP